MSDTLNYPGNCANVDPDHLVGPDMFGAHYLALSATYDRERNTTAISFCPVPPAELAQRVAKLKDEATQRIHLQLLFGTFDAAVAQ